MPFFDIPESYWFWGPLPDMGLSPLNLSLLPTTFLRLVAILHLELVISLYPCHLVHEQYGLDAVVYGKMSIAVMN